MKIIKREVVERITVEFGGAVDTTGIVGEGYRILAHVPTADGKRMQVVAERPEVKKKEQA